MADLYKFKSKSRGIKALEEMGYRINNGCVLPPELPRFWPVHLEPTYTIHIPMAHLNENGLLRFRQSENPVLRESQGELESELDEYFSRNGH